MNNFKVFCDQEGITEYAIRAGTYLSLSTISHIWGTSGDMKYKQPNKSSVLLIAYYMKYKLKVEIFKNKSTPEAYEILFDMINAPMFP